MIDFIYQFPNIVLASPFIVFSLHFVHFSNILLLSLTLEALIQFLLYRYFSQTLITMRRTLYEIFFQIFFNITCHVLYRKNRSCLLFILTIGILHRANVEHPTLHVNKKLFLRYCNVAHRSLLRQIGHFTWIYCPFVSLTSKLS